MKGTNECCAASTKDRNHGSELTIFKYIKVLK